MNKNLRHALLAAATLGLAGVAPMASAAPADDWQWVVAPYVWAATLGTDFHTRLPPQGVSNDTEFDDIIDKLDGAFQLHAEGQNEKFGVFTDFTYIGLADTKDHARATTESDIDARLFELAAVWSPAEGRYQGFEVFAGLRYIDVDLTVRVDPVNPAFNTTTIDASKTYNDFMLGARYSWALSDNWGVTLRGDSSFGDTEGTWNASAIANYRTSYGTWFLGYRHLSVELETGSRDTNTEVTMSGPIFGYGFVF